MFIAASGRKTGSLPDPPFPVQIGDTLNRSESSVNHGFQQFAPSFNRTAVMFGGEFGAFQSRQRHFFNEESPAYRQLAIILRLRREKLSLRRGRQYLREISGNGIDFGPPRMLGGQIRSVVPWSRIFNDQEILLAMNTDYSSPRSAWVTIDDGLHQAGQILTCLYSTDSGQIGQEVTVEPRNGKVVVLTLPAGGFVIYE